MVSEAQDHWAERKQGDGTFEKSLVGTRNYKINSLIFPKVGEVW
jgi:hypothetical protein